MLTHGLIIASYGVFAGLIGLVLPHSAPSIDPVTGYVVAGCLFLAAALMHEMVARRRYMRNLVRSMEAAWGGQADEVDMLRQVNRRLVDDLAEAREEVSKLRGTVEEGMGNASDAVVAEMKVLQAQLRQLGQGGRSDGTSPEPAAVVADGRMDTARILEVTRSALEENRVDLYLQPIVSLPQRKVRYYEAYSRIRTSDGSVILPEQYLDIAAEDGLIVTIDNLLLFRCVQLLRRQRQRNREIGFFVPVSSTTLRDADFLSDFVQFLAANRDLAANLIFEFSQKDFLEQAAHVKECVRRLAEFEFRFSVDQVSGLDLDFRQLAAQRVEFLKVPQSLLLTDGTAASAGLHPGDLKERLRRNRIDLVVDHIEDEATVIELLDFEVDFGQGYLFGEPRPARED
ncbi:MAG: EAL domain-containing protein [Alphaproteobacteria bacterium]|nr:EAL domain-containing protein [Alphaproteobacteria bacterium]